MTGQTVSPVERAEGIRDASALLLDEVKASLDTLTVRDGQRLVSLAQEIRGWLVGVEQALR